MANGLCSRCPNILDRGKSRYCKKCHNAYMRKWRKYNSVSEEQRIKGIARSKLKMRIRRGTMSKQPCSICFSTKFLEAHHHDYSKPYDVIWFCRFHHNEHHKKTG